ncbi:MAG: oligoendopeptidase F [Clostridia bacterium]|nr:oligoendopeptidase F [Clostridia bacterium]
MTQSKQIPQRKEIDDKYKWQVEHIYPNQAAWRIDCQKIKELLPKAAAFVGRLAESPDLLADFFAYREELSLLLDKVYLYASMKKDEDNTVALYQGMKDNATALYISISQALAFFEPEFLAIPAETVKKFSEHPRLLVYQKHINDINRQRAHILSQKEEEILAQTGEMASSFRNIFTMFNNADIDFPEIVNAEGQNEKISHGNYLAFLESTDRRVRCDAFKGLYATYRSHINTLAATYAASVKKDCFYAKIRKFPSALEGSLFDDNVPPAVYDNLIATVRKHLSLFQRYLQLRKKLLGLNELHFYDLYCPLFHEGERKYSYEQGQELVLKGLAPLREQYLQIMKFGFENGWVDAYENKGKTSGAHSTGCQGQYPYILMNWQDNLNSVFTLAHEGGHSLHSWFTWQNQPPVYAEYRIFVAEVASTVNETLLLDYMLKNSTGKSERLALLNHYLEEFRGTVFRQTMFAEFEKIVHQKAENDEPLTAESLCEIYRALNYDYFGDIVVLDEEIALEWARIPHFYSAFYVYKYATGFSAAQALAGGLLQDTGNTAYKNYLEFLSAGDSLEPLEALKVAGVDMTSPTPIEQAMEIFAERLSEIEELIK